jgi:cyclopropane-fatty-acyl-phospholipid synthase
MNKTLRGKKMAIAETFVRNIFNNAGIAVNGKNPWDIVVHNPRFYSRVLSQGSLGLGHSYMDSWWDCERLDQFFALLLRRPLPWIAKLNPVAVKHFLSLMFMDAAPKKKAFLVGEKHYDLGNDFFEVILPEMLYSCPYYRGLPRDVEHLPEAQIAKIDLICRKIDPRYGQRILDVGCGWGTQAYYLATEYGAEVVGLTVSEEQAIYAREKCKGLLVKILFQDYRDVEGTFDHIVSVGMVEHVGRRNLETYMRVMSRCLSPDGLFLLHGICTPQTFLYAGDPWIKEEIFPVGDLPSYRQIERSSKKAGLEIIDVHEF